MQTISTAKESQFESLWQAYMPDVAWGSLLLAIGIGGGYYLTISSALESSLPYPVATSLCVYLAFASFTVMHDAGHGSIFRANTQLKPLESLIGWMASLPLLIAPYRFFQKIHDRHHAFTNDPDRDPDHYTFANNWFTLVLNCLYIPVKYHVLALTKLRRVKVIRDTYTSTAAYFLVTIGGLVTLTALGFGFEVLCFAIIPNVIAVFLLVMFFDYVPHHPHKSRDRYHDTRIYPSKILNALLLGQNYHLIHHMYPRLPWYTYQAVYHRILPDLEAHNTPIEDISGGIRPRFMKSPHTQSLLDGGRSINMLLEVSQMKALTPDAVSIQFKLPEGERLNYQAGQYITVSKWLAGEQQSRCYSLCSSPNKGELKIAVRKTEKGLVSNFLNQDLKVGDELIVEGPFGDFVYPFAEAKQVDHLVLIAGGSGITPILSIVETALGEGSSASILLIYACRNRDSIMFFEDLERLKQAHRDRLTVRYVVGQGSDQSSAQDRVQALDLHGRLDAPLMKQLLPELSDSKQTGVIQNTEFYICGPEGLKNGVLDLLEKACVCDERVHVEQFVSTLTQPMGTLYPVNVSLADGNRHTLSVASNQTVLEVAKAEGVQLPHACGSGTCGSCKFKVEQGAVATIPDTIPGITLEEKQAGFTLACQCHPLQNLLLSEV